MSWQDLDGDITSKAGVPGTIHFSHPARSEGREDFIGAEAASSNKSHTWREL